jgi:hypothetical protein
MDSQDQDILDMLDKVSKGAFRLFNEIKKRRSPNSNLAHYPTVDFNKTQRESFSRQLKELRDLGLVKVAKRKMVGVDLEKPYLIQRQTYMINPDLVKCWHYEDAAMLWIQCKS